MRGLLLAGLACLVQAAAVAQELPVLHLSAQLVLLDVTVERRGGGRVEPLAPGDFTVVENGVELPPGSVTYISADRLPLSLVLVLDASRAAERMRASLSAQAGQVVAGLRPQDEVAVMTFTRHAHLLQHFTTDRGLLRAALGRAAEEREPEGAELATALVEATGESALTRLEQSRHVELWLMGSRLAARDAADARRVVEHGNVTVAAIVPAGGEAAYGIGEFAALTGGPVLEGDAAGRMVALLDALHQRYTVGFKPGACAVGAVCRVEVRLSAGFFARHAEVWPADVVVRAPASYLRQGAGGAR